MTHLLHELRWTSAVVGVACFLIGVLVTLTNRRPARRRSLGFFALQFGAALILFNVAGFLAKERAWSTATVLGGAVLLASSVRKLFTLNST